ncbi:hypothetical protein ACWDNT_30795 [Streptomyces sp. NPDC000963]
MRIRVPPSVTPDGGKAIRGLSGGSRPGPSYDLVEVLPGLGTGEAVVTVRGEGSPPERGALAVRTGGGTARRRR